MLRAVWHLQRSIYIEKCRHRFYQIVSRKYARHRVSLTTIKDIFQTTLQYYQQGCGYNEGKYRKLVQNRCLCIRDGEQTDQQKTDGSKRLQHDWSGDKESTRCYQDIRSLSTNKAIWIIKWQITGGLFVPSLFCHNDQLSRQAGLIPYLEDYLVAEFHWKNNDYGTITVVFSIAYAYLYCWPGKFVDWMDTKRISLGGGIWSFGACLHAFCGITTSGCSCRQNGWLGLKVPKTH